ncbi:MAG TPA: lysophospholipid acyltransferase family protein [bacterium]|nr:lysophospholipid acyltransferase family protein [bacterium]
MWYSLWKGFFALCFRSLFRLRIEGREHEPPSGPLLAICNHVSAADPFIAGVALRRNARYMAKQELFKNPVLGALLRSVGSFPVRRGQADRQSIRTALQALAHGEVLVMFPEGTRSHDGRLMPAEPGAALLALRAGAPVLPMAVAGTQHAMPKGRTLPRCVQVVVRIGPPLAVPKHEGRIDRADLDAWGRRFMAAIAALLPPDQQPGPVGQPPAAQTLDSRTAPTVPD